MDAYIKWMDGHSRLVKIILCIWILDITWAVYRILGAVKNKNWLHLVLAILWIIAAGTIGWVLDIIFIIIKNRIFWFAE
ncbi:MAG: hypothetical protein K5694_00995 [Bacilli bacterium]|nr:hypothetical protein [Bacilli bacterium]